jgi:uncharacterized repeat protein (TIGR01451 family)
MTERENRVGFGKPSRVVVLLTAIALLLGMGITAFADSPSPSGATHGTVVNNGTTATVTLSGTLAWGKKQSCTKDAGYSVDWGDPSQAGNPIGGPSKKKNQASLTADVGVLNGANGLNATDNAVHPAGCSGNVITWGPISHVYHTSNSTITACPVGYHIKHNNLIAGGPGHADDNSIEENGVLDLSTCFLFKAPPPPPPPHHDSPSVSLTLDKKVNGGDHATNADRLEVFNGDQLVYTIVITNTGDAPLTISNLQDTLHANLPADCDKGNGVLLNKGDTIQCSYAELASAPEHNVASVTGTPKVGPPVSADDETFVTIRAGVTIPPVSVARPPAAIVATPHTTG